MGKRKRAEADPWGYRQMSKKQLIVLLRHADEEVARYRAERDKAQFELIAAKQSSRAYRDAVWLLKANLESVEERLELVVDRLAQASRRTPRRGSWRVKP